MSQSIFNRLCSCVDNLAENEVLHLGGSLTGISSNTVTAFATAVDVNSMDIVRQLPEYTFAQSELIEFGTTLISAMASDLGNVFLQLSPRPVLVFDGILGYNYRLEISSPDLTLKNYFHLLCDRNVSMDSMHDFISEQGYIGLRFAIFLRKKNSAAKPVLQPKTNSSSERNKSNDKINSELQRIAVHAENRANLIHDYINGKVKDNVIPQPEANWTLQQASDRDAARLDTSKAFELLKQQADRNLTNVQNEIDSPDEIIDPTIPPVVDTEAKTLDADSVDGLDYEDDLPQPPNTDTPQALTK